MKKWDGNSNKYDIPLTIMIWSELIVDIITVTADVSFFCLPVRYNVQAVQCASRW